MAKHYVILGGGISGLSLAWALQREKDVAITLVEREPRLGGWIDTLQSDGFVFERGPRSCRTRGTGIATLRLIEELGLQGEVLPASPNAKKRFLYQNKALQPVPSDLLSLAFSPLTKGICKALWQDWKTKGGPGRDESIAAFVERRLGQGFAERFFDPLISGIFAGDIQKLSIRACFPVLAAWEENKGGLIRGAFASRKKRETPLSPFVQKMLKTPIFSFRRGMETLTQALTQQIKGEILLGQGAEAIQCEPEGVTIRLSSGKTLWADELYSTISSSSLGNLLAPQDPYMANRLKQIPSTSVAVVNLGYRKRLLKEEGFGYLIPSSEGETVLGVVWDSSIFPEQACYPEETRLTVMLGGTRMHHFDRWTANEFSSAAQEAVARHLGIDAIPEAVYVKRARHAIPQYHVGHLDKISSLEYDLASQYPRLNVLGHSYFGISVNDCIKASLDCGI